MAGLSCPDCPMVARSAAGLASHRRAKHADEQASHRSVLEATDAAVGAAQHLGDMDGGSVEVLRSLARTIDNLGQRGPDAPLDNVTIPTYLKYATELGLTPLSRLKFPKREDSGGSKLAQLRSIRGGQAS